MSEFDFLSKTPADAREAKDLPDGAYRFAIRSYAFFKEGEDQKEVVRVNLKPLQVIAAQFPESELDLAKNASMKFWYTEKALALMDRPTISMKAFLKHVLSSTVDEDTFNVTPYAQLWEAALGKEFSAEVKNELEGKNKDIPRLNVKRILAN